MATPTPVIVESASIDQTSAHVDWQAILAGAVAAAGLSAIFITFGGAIGLSMSSARPYAGWSATVIAVVAGLWMALSQVGSFAAGGYVAGRLRHRTGVSRSETSFRDGAHGFIVWCVGTLVGAYLLASGAASLVSGAADAAKTATTATAAAVAAGSSSIPDPVGYAVDTMLRRSGPEPTAGPANTQPSPRDREISAEIAKIFVINAPRSQLATPDRDYLVGLVRTRSGLTAPGEAEKRVDAAWSQIQTLKSETEAKARDAAEAVRRSALIGAFLAAAVSLAALVAAVTGAVIGSHHRDTSVEPTFMGTRLW